MLIDPTFRLSIDFEKNIIRAWNSKYRYLCQQSSGYWYLYSALPKFTGFFWCSSAFESILVGSGAMHKEQTTLIIDLGDDIGD